MWKRGCERGVFVLVVCEDDKLWQRVQGDFSQCSYEQPYSWNRVELFLPVFMCSSTPMIAFTSTPATVCTSCNECPSLFFTDMVSCTTGKNNQLVPHGGRPHDNMKRGLNICCRGRMLRSPLRSIPFTSHRQCFL